MVTWTQTLNPSSETEPLPAFHSTSLTFTMSYCDPVPHASIARHIEQNHGAVRGQRSQGKIIVIQGDEASSLFLGGVNSDGPLVTVDVLDVTLRHDTFAPHLLDQISFSFPGRAQTDGFHGAEAAAEFHVSFDNEAAFWAFVSLLTGENFNQMYRVFQRTGIRYHDSLATTVSPTEATIGPMPGWAGVQTLLCVAMLGFLPSYLVSLLFIVYFSVV